ncbi:MAG: ABC transporter permease [Candidatus Peribacteria bacterium]|nr:ABC transporter permease [Candidatus Peribacteria bacterium]
MFKKEFKRTIKGLIIWSIIIVLLAMMALLEYPVIGQYADLMDEHLAEFMPKIAQLVFGIYNINLKETIGWFVVMYYWTGLIVFTHAIYTGASLISKEIRDKTSEYLFTKPCKRSTIVWAKTFAGFANILVINLVATIMSLILMIPMTKDPVIYGQVLIGGIGMLLTQCVLMSIGFVCSGFFKSYASGVKAAMISLIIFYCLMFFVQYIDMPSLNFLSPLTYFSVSDVVAN